MSSAHDPLACASLPERLRRLERACGDASSVGEAQALERHLESCPECTQRHALRVAALRRTCALRARELPTGLLDDLRSRVLAQVAQGGSGGMSPAFLDAPASLALWRRVALAASVLLAAGVGFVATGRVQLKPTPGQGERDLRDALLPSLATGSPRGGNARDGDEDLLQPVLLPGVGVRGFYDPWDAGPRPAARPRRAPPTPSAPETGD